MLDLAENLPRTFRGTCNTETQVKHRFIDGKSMNTLRKIEESSFSVWVKVCSIYSSRESSRDLAWLRIYWYTLRLVIIRLRPRKTSHRPENRDTAYTLQTVA